MLFNLARYVLAWVSPRYVAVPARAISRSQMMMHMMRVRAERRRQQ